MRDRDMRWWSSLYEFSHGAPASKVSKAPIDFPAEVGPGKEEKAAVGHRQSVAAARRQNKFHKNKFHKNK